MRRRGRHADLEWTNPADSDFAEVEIRWTPEDGEPQPKVLGEPASTATIMGLADDTQYDSTVTALDAFVANGNGQETNQVFVGDGSGSFTVTHPLGETEAGATAVAIGELTSQ
jgi:hypothetical protein